MSVLRAIFLSLLIHAALAAVAVLLLSAPSTPTVRVALDLSRVDLSLAEREAEAPPVEALPAIPDEPPPKPRLASLRPPEPPQERPAMRSPEVGAPILPEPQVEISMMVTPSSREIVMAQPPKSVSAPAPRLARVDAPPKPKRTIRPVYPDGARLRGEEGSVTVAFMVGAEGAASDAHIAVSSGFAELDDAALKAVCAARFTPARTDGTSIAAPARITLQFKLR